MTNQKRGLMARCKYLPQCEVISDCKVNFPTAYTALENRYCCSKYSDCERYKKLKAKATAVAKVTR